MSLTETFHLKRTFGNKVLKEKYEQLNVSYVLLGHWERIQMSSEVPPSY